MELSRVDWERVRLFSGNLKPLYELLRSLDIVIGPKGKVTLTRAEKQLSFKLASATNAYEVLSYCGNTYFESRDFESYCSEYGEGAQMSRFRKALKWSEKLRFIFTPEEIRLLPC